MHKRDTLGTKQERNLLQADAAAVPSCLDQLASATKGSGNYAKGDGKGDGKGGKPPRDPKTKPKPKPKKKGAADPLKQSYDDCLECVQKMKKNMADAADLLYQFEHNPNYSWASGTDRTLLKNAYDVIFPELHSDFYKDFNRLRWESPFMTDICAWAMGQRHRPTSARVCFPFFFNLSLSVYIYIYMYVCMYVCMSLSFYLYRHLYICKCVWPDGVRLSLVGSD